MRMTMMLVAVGLVAGCASGGGSAGPAHGGEAAAEGAPAQPAMTAEQHEEIEQARRAGMSGLNTCFESELERRKDPKLRGKVTLKIQIGSEGKALEVIIAETTFDAPRMHECIQQQLPTWEFPALMAPTWYGTTVEFSPAY